jgi:hypothetical protein
MKTSGLAKFFAYFGASAAVIGQSGIFGKYSNFFLLFGPILAAFGIHAASATDGTK